MGINITIYGWMIPTSITIITFGYAIFIYDDGPGLWQGIGNLLLLVPASFISMIAWIIYAIFK
jgi:hypothetical protein